MHYGHSIIGKVWYDDANPDGCKDYNMIFDATGDPDIDPSPIVLVNRGNCSFTQKARNVEHAGGRLAIIIDDKISENPEDVIMVDDGSGNGIMIPSILISKVNGDYILKEMEDDRGTHNGTLVQLYASFDMSHPDNRVEWDFWYSSANDKALNFLKDYYELHVKLGDKALFTPHYAFFACIECDKITKERDCFGNGKYCALDGLSNKLKGKDILYENLRQKCLHNYLEDHKKENMWWEYIIKFLEICSNEITEDCSKCFV